MDNPWLIAVLGVVAILVLVLAMVWLANTLTDRLVGSKHRAAEYIVNTGKVPPAWLGRRYRADQAPDPQREAAARNDVLRRLDALIVHFGHSAMVEDEETRDVLLGELYRARTAWQTRPWREIV